MTCQPQGKLTLQKGFAIPTQDVINATQIWLHPKNGGNLPLFNGSAMVDTCFLSGPADQYGPSLPLNAVYHNGYDIYDVYAFLVSGQVVIGSSPAWQGVFPGSRGTGTATPCKCYGVDVNSAAINLTYWSGSAYLTTNVPVYQATFLGSFLTWNGPYCSMVMNPAAIAGGTQNVLGLWNNYNRDMVTAICKDSTVSFNDIGPDNCVTPFNVGVAGGAGNRIWWIDGMAQSPVDAYASASVQPAVAGPTAYTLGLGYDQVTVINGYGVNTQTAFENGLGFAGTATTWDSQPGKLGLHFYQLLQESTPLGMQVDSVDMSGFKITLEM